MTDVVIINCFDTYEHRVELLKKYFSAQGKNVEVITSDWQHFQKTVREDCPDEYTMIHAKPYYKNLSVGRLRSHYQFAKDALTEVGKRDPRLVWILVPPNALIKFAERYKKNHPNVKVVLDFIDMWPETMPISRFKKCPPFSFWKNLRDKHLQFADTVVTECALYHTLLEKYYPAEKIHTIYLARHITPVKLECNVPKDRISLCYLGSINNIIDISCIGSIIRAIDAPVDLHIIGDGEKRQMLLEVGQASGANVIFHGRIYDVERKKAILDQCHFGLNVMKPSVFVGLTMKSMDYFEYGLPLINNIHGDTWDFVDRNAIGINYSPSSRLNVEQLLHISHNRQNVRQFFENYFSYESFTRQVDSIISNLYSKELDQRSYYPYDDVEEYKK